MVGAEMMILSGGLISTPIGQAGDVRRFSNCVARILRRVSLTRFCSRERHCNCRCCIFDNTIMSVTVRPRIVQITHYATNIS